MKKNAENFFEKISTKITNWTGSPVAFGVAGGVCVGWGGCGASRYN
jgi:low affinity Fe/Cu permease